MKQAAMQYSSASDFGDDQGASSSSDEGAVPPRHLTFSVLKYCAGLHALQCTATEFTLEWVGLVFSVLIVPYGTSCRLGL
jgi:hypothetical protein